MAGDAERPRLRELRAELGWTQQQLADKLAQLAWTHGQGHAAVNADMVAKWERGVKGVSPRYRALLCQLFGVTADQLGIGPAVSPASCRPVRDAESLVSMLDDAASLLDQLGAAGTALAPQMLSAWKDTVTTRRTMLGLLDPAATDPAGHARAATATISDLEQLAERYQVLHATADPAALLTRSPRTSGWRPQPWAANILLVSGADCCATSRRSPPSPAGWPTRILVMLPPAARTTAWLPIAPGKQATTRPPPPFSATPPSLPTPKG
ncbi:MAG TPA: helix-turn-helix transcriptional regulator [Pseudonocardiaceae bacterium]|nr:helix-turn-helix transcriptional regulator [Pseudonocardiaceae bacterium]